MSNNHFEPAPRAMYKGELALTYNPDMEPRAALRTLNQWVALSPGLTDRLEATGWRKTSRMLSPLQVRLIYDALGQP